VNKKVIHYLCGLPRSGNTILSTILNQNPDIAATPNSVITEIFKDLHNLKNSDVFQNYPNHKSYDNVIKAVIPEYYKDWKESIIIDRGPWGAPNNLKFLKHYVNPKPKIVVLVRDVLEVLASFIEWADKNYDAFPNRAGTMDTEKRCDLLMNQDGLIVKELIAIKHLVDHHPGTYKLVDYNDLVKNPEKIIKEIYEFYEIKSFKHNLKNFKQFKVNGMSYDDEVVGANLHTIKTKGINKTKRNINKVLPKSIIKKYGNLNVWTN
jgi:sulfotransferase